MTDPLNTLNDSIWQHPTVPPSVLFPGEALGRFEITEMIGRGGMGEVWKAFDPHRQTHVVVKLLPLLQLGNEVELHRIRESFRKVSKLQHQHICPVYDLDIDKRVGHYLVMKFIEGETLAVYRYRLAKSAAGVSAKHAVDVLRPIATALDYAHKEKVIHRDVKPQNIMVGDDGGGAQLVDFGLADEIRLSATRVSRVQVDISGTYPYMSPEQWRGRQQDGRTDQYALAVVVYEFIAGHPPFESADTAILRECVLTEEPAPLPSISVNANRVLRRAMAKESTERFDSCIAFLDALESALADKSSKDNGSISANPHDESSENIYSYPTAVNIEKPPVSQHLTSVRAASPRSKETWYTAALVLTIASTAWLLRDEWLSTSAGSPSATVAASTSPANLVTSTAPPISSSPSSATTSNSAPPLASSTTSVSSGSTPPTPASPQTASPLPASSMPQAPQQNTPTVSPTAIQPKPTVDAALVKNVEQSQDLANKAKRDAVNDQADQYAREEWNRADALLSNANKSFADADLSTALEQYQTSARTFYTAIDKGRKAYAISQNFRELLRELTSLREEAESVESQRLAADHFSQAIAANEEMKRLYEANEYLAAAGKLEEAKSGFRTAIAQARAMEKIELARKTYDRQINGIDPKLLEQHGGKPWQDAVYNIQTAEAGSDIAKLQSSYTTAFALLPAIHTKIREEEIAGLSTSGNHKQVLDILWPNWNSLEPVMKKTFVSSASVSPEWWLEQASKQVDASNADAHGKAMLYLSISDVYRRQRNLTSTKAYVTKAMNASLKVSESREAMETSLEIAQEIDGKADPKLLAALVTQANVDLDSINEAVVKYPESQEVPWIKYYFPIRFAALCWRAGDRDAADRYSQLAYSSSLSAASFYADLPGFQAILVFAEAGDVGMLNRMPYVDKGRVLVSHMVGSRPYKSLQGSELFQISRDHGPPNGTNNYELLAQAEIALAAARTGDDVRYRIHSRHGETMVKELALSQSSTWTVSMVNSRLAMGEAYQQEFVAAAGRLRNSVKHRFALGEAALTLGRRQLVSKSDVLNNNIDGAKNTLTEFGSHPRLSLLAKDIASSSAKEDFAATIDWANSLSSDHLRIAAMAGMAEAAKP